MFTAQEVSILNMLADGRPHTVSELLTCMTDEMSDRSALLMAISKLRKKLVLRNQYIYCLLTHNGTPTRYVHVIPATISKKTIKSL